MRWNICSLGNLLKSVATFLNVILVKHSQAIRERMIPLPPSPWRTQLKGNLSGEVRPGCIEKHPQQSSSSFGYFIHKTHPRKKMATEKKI
jgi:hypothetical protein